LIIAGPLHRSVPYRWVYQRQPVLLDGLVRPRLYRT